MIALRFWAAKILTTSWSVSQSGNILYVGSLLFKNKPGSGKQLSKSRLSELWQKMWDKYLVIC
jgi:hypothetical protein